MKLFGIKGDELLLPKKFINEHIEFCKSWNRLIDFEFGEGRLGLSTYNRCDDSRSGSYQWNK